MSAQFVTVDPNVTVYVASLYRRHGWTTIAVQPNAESPVLAWEELGSGANLAVCMQADSTWRSIGISVRSDSTERAGGRVTRRQGYEAMMGLLEQLGPLPPTWSSSCFRDDPVHGHRPRERTNGIRFYRVPVDIELVRSAGRNVFIISGDENYAMIAPSVVDNMLYRLYSPSLVGAAPAALPPLGQLPELPAAWLEHCTRKPNPDHILELTTAR